MNILPTAQLHHSFTSFSPILVQQVSNRTKQILLIAFVALNLLAAYYLTIYCRFKDKAVGREEQDKKIPLDKQMEHQKIDEPKTHLKQTELKKFSPLSPPNEFTFESIALKVKVDEFKGSRQLDLNPGIEVTINSATKKKSLVISCNNFKREIKTADPYYKRRFSDQAVEINHLIELIETIQNQASPAELKKLDEMKNCISTTCSKALSWTHNEETKRVCNVYQFIIPGKRINPDTFEFY